MHDPGTSRDIGVFRRKANAIFRSKKEKNPATQSCREAKNLQLCAAGFFNFGPFRVALDLRVDVVNVGQ